MERLASVEGLVVSQKKEWGEILTGYETRNKYVVLDSMGSELYKVVEEPGSVLARLFLKALRPFEISVFDQTDVKVLRVVRPFRFFFYRLDVYDGQSGALLGTVVRRFSLLRRIYSVFDGTGREAYQLFGPILHPWTFEIREGEMIHGKITKKWSGLLKEGFTDADNFGVTFPPGWDVKLKGLFLGAVFLIDFAHFENKGKN